MTAPTPPALRARRLPGATSPPTTTMRSAISARRATSPIPATAPTRAGDTPQEVLFIVTDGVEDEESGGSRLQQAMNDLGNAPGRQFEAAPTGAPQSRTAASRSPSSIPTISPFRPIAGTRAGSPRSSRTSAPAMQACASPGLFYDAAIGSDLGQALRGAVRRGDKVGASDQLRQEKLKPAPAIKQGEDLAAGRTTTRTE